MGQVGTTARHPRDIAETDRHAVLDGSVSMEGIVAKIKRGEIKNIVVLAGAGISVAAGIPDFRSPGSGLYANLAKYKLPTPESMFDISYFRRDPRPFFHLAKELFPGKFAPTRTHYFFRLLHEKGLLRRIFTQNIDTLERIAGIPEDKLCEAHGSFEYSTCTKCRVQYGKLWMKDAVMAGRVPKCKECGGVVKPDITFFGESLPSRYRKLCGPDTDVCDLLIVAGTSLKVAPIDGLPDLVSDLCPRLLINREKVSVAGDSGSEDEEDIGSWVQQRMPSNFVHADSGTFRFDKADNYRDVFLGGDADDGVDKIVTALGWMDEFEELIKAERELLAAAAATDAAAEAAARRRSSADSAAGGGAGAGPSRGVGVGTDMDAPHSVSVGVGTGDDGGSGTAVSVGVGTDGPTSAVAEESKGTDAAVGTSVSVGVGTGVGSGAAAGASAGFGLGSSATSDDEDALGVAPADDASVAALSATTPAHVREFLLTGHDVREAAADDEGEGIMDCPVDIMADALASLGLDPDTDIDALPTETAAPAAGAGAAAAPAARGEEAPVAPAPSELGAGAGATATE